MSSSNHYLHQREQQQELPVEQHVNDEAQQDEQEKDKEIAATGEEDEDGDIRLKNENRIVSNDSLWDDNDDPETDDNNSSSSTSNSAKNEIPLFYYTRMYGSLPRGSPPSLQSHPEQRQQPRILSTPCTCSVMGKVVVTSETCNLTSDRNVTSVDQSAIPSVSIQPTNSSPARGGSQANFTSATASDMNASMNAPTNANVDWSDQTSLWLNETIPIMGIGLQDGHLLLMDAATGSSVLSNAEKPYFRVRGEVATTPTSSATSTSTLTSSTSTSTITANYSPIAAVSLDSTGTSFGAIDEGGMCCIWTIKYKIQMRPSVPPIKKSTSQPSSSISASIPATAAQQQQQQQQPSSSSPKQGGNIFTNVFSAFNWQQPKPSTAPQQQQQSTSSNTDTTAADSSNTVLAEGGGEYKEPESTTPPYVPTLTVSESKLHRVNYPKSMGKPTCMALDPAYGLKRETSLLVGFADGRIVLSKRGWLLQRREDKFIQYIGPAADKDFKGIEAMVWRGSILAFADCSGVRLYDTETFRPIAHVDRPTGARPSLYPSTIQNTVAPNLCFETSTSLLVAWGDCLLNMKIRETTTATIHNTSSTTTSFSSPPGATSSTTELIGGGGEETNSNQPEASLPSPSTDNASNTGFVNASQPPSTPAHSSSTAPPPPSVPSPAPLHHRKRIVECSMAWALDVIACGVVPLDENHVVVLGIIPPLEEEEEDHDDAGTHHDYKVAQGNSNRKNDERNETLELQVISRLNGNVVYSDVLPLLPLPPSTPSSAMAQASTSAPNHYFLLSSFAVPRMENALELAEEMKVVDTWIANYFLDTDGRGAMMNDPFTNPIPSATQTSQYEECHPEDMYHRRKQFKDCHLKWNIDMVQFVDDDEERKKKVGLLRSHDDFDAGLDDEFEDTDSIDSDDYGFVRRPLLPNADISLQSHASNASQSTTPHQHHRQVQSYPAVSYPWMIIASSADVVVARIRNIDDAITYTLEQRKKPATALRMAIQHIRSLRKYDSNNIDELINHYFRALLRIENNDDDTNMYVEEKPKNVTPGLNTQNHLSLRRMKLAAEAMPILLGGNVLLWEHWLSELENIPGALFVVRNYLPVRDPKLPSSVYESVLTKMLEQAESMKMQILTPSSEFESTTKVMREKLALEAENHFLNALLAWGTSTVIKEQIILYEYQIQRDPSASPLLQILKESLSRREEQSASGYLNFPRPHQLQNDPLFSPNVTDGSNDVPVVGNAQSGAMSPKDALYNIDTMTGVVASRISFARSPVPASALQSKVVTSSLKDSRVALEAMAKLFLMTGRHEDALRYFLVIGARHGTMSLSDLEQMAVAVVNNEILVPTMPGSDTQSKYTYLLYFVEKQFLYQNLLDRSFLPESATLPPMVALMRLVGLDFMGDFLIEHCVPPQHDSTEQRPEANRLAAKNTSGSNTVRTGEERRGTLPLDLVAQQLGGIPQLLHWYLHLVFTRKPEIYVKFPNTANPPPEINNLHKKQLDLYVKYAGNNRDSARTLEGIEAYRVIEKSTPLLSFLKVILQLGSISPVDVGKMLQKERRGGAGVSSTFALELAYIMEHFGDDSESDARLILELYLHGAKSLMLAVSFAQRTSAHSVILWEILINFCTSTNARSLPTASVLDGTLFGSLLEAAALCGADLAHLVTQIPTGMKVEGLRPRLVAAVADYRLKVQMQQSASKIASQEKVTLLREVAQRSRKGMRVDEVDISEMSHSNDLGQHQISLGLSQSSSRNKRDKNINNNMISPLLRTVERRDRHVLKYALPIR